MSVFLTYFVFQQAKCSDVQGAKLYFLDVNNNNNIFIKANNIQ